MERLNALIQSRPQSGAARNVRHDHDRLLAQMASFEAAKLEEWCANIADVSEQTLKQPLLRCGRRHHSPQPVVVTDPPAPSAAAHCSAV